MVMVTTKFNRKRAVAALIALGAVLILIVLLAGLRHDGSNAAFSRVVRSNSDRVKYLESFGWEIGENAVEELTVIIPRDLDGVYKKYNEIQTAQGFDLSKHGGEEAVRYTYRILNFPGGDDSAVADIIVYRNEIIAGDVQSVRLDGFMRGLEYPELR
ncbi:MAG: DUF4830 domain-containing protein [Oscillospiraceae bacterium]|jgi:hypothetical protein|nr:DUF4830 domain-containing protein [Oscillospiraceae bacterium]